ncbi:MAG TPA: universal stress protein [bacterium]|nr:universal stress protein [bacterium]
MYRRILIPADGNAGSDGALTHALQLAKEQGAEVIPNRLRDGQARAKGRAIVNVRIAGGEPV